jgi:nucleotide-binding universal stress UspA family protein
MFERILIPLDGSLRSELLLTQMGPFRRQGESEIHLLTVLAPEVLPRGASLSGFSQGERGPAEKYLTGLVERFGGRGTRWKTHVLAGKIASTILKVADEENCTLIVMSTHGRTGLSRFIMGSVAEKVARGSRVPMLMFRSYRPGVGGGAAQTAAEELSFQRILVPTDGSAAARAGIGCAVECARAFSATAVVVHSEFPFIPPGPEFENFPTPAPTPSLEDPVTETAAEAFGNAGVRATRITEIGDPAGVILDQCTATQADLIVMGTHGRSGAPRWMLGSVAERVLRHAQVPVLLVPARKSRSSSRSPRSHEARAS